MFKELGQFASLMKQAQAMRGRMTEMQENLRRLKIEASAGGGMVTVEMNGQHQVLGCRIDESLLTAGDREVIEDLVVAAMNQALEKVERAAKEEMGRIAGGMDIPGLNEALSQLGGEGR